MLDILHMLDISPDEYENIHIFLRDVAHVVMFATLGFFATLLTRSYTHRSFGWAISAVSCSVYAVLDECVQLWTARGRAFELNDILKDCLGVVLGVAVVFLGCLFVAKVRQKRGN